MALKLKQVYIYQFSTFSLLSNEENEMADELKKYSKEKLQVKKEEFHKKLADFKGIRSIRKSSMTKSIENFLENKGTNLVSLFESDISQWIEKNKPENMIEYNKVRNFEKV